MTTRFTVPFPPGPPIRPDRPARPGHPDHPLPPGWPSAPAPSGPPAAPARAWLAGDDWTGRLYDRLLSHRIVFAHGFLDADVATRLSAQLLTLDAEGSGPIRLELQNTDADLGAAVTVMGVLDTLRAPVATYAGGQIRGPALGVLTAASQRFSYPNASFVLREPRVSPFTGTASALSAAGERTQALLDELFARIASATGQEPAQVRADAKAERVLTVPEAIEYGLITEAAAPRKTSGETGF